MNAHEDPDAKRQKLIFQLSSEQLVQLFPLESSEVLVRCGQRHVGGGKEGSSFLTLRAGERFEVVVTIKSRLGPITGQHVEQMMRLIKIVLPGFIRDPGDGWSKASPDYKPDPAWIWDANLPAQFEIETGVVTFPVQILKTGHFEISAAVEHNSNIHTIGGVKLNVEPGTVKFEKLTAKEEVEVGEQVDLVLLLGDTDCFGNKLTSPLSKSSLASMIAGLHLEGQWKYQASSSDEGENAPLRLTEPKLNVNEDGIIVGQLDLRIPGKHTFLIRVQSSDQRLSTEVTVVPGKPHTLQFKGAGRPHVLRQIRWGCQAQVLNGSGHPIDISPSDFTAKMVFGDGANGGQDTTLHLKASVSRRKERIKPCSLADTSAVVAVQDLEVFLLETTPPPPRGPYSLHEISITPPGKSMVTLICDPSESTIQLDLPNDPAQWKAEDVAESLRHAGFEGLGDVLKNEFGDHQVSGKELIDKGRDMWVLLRDCLFAVKKPASQVAKDLAEKQIKDVASSLMEKHTVAKLGQGKFQSCVAKCISESDDLVLESEPFERGGTAKIFRGDYQMRSVAVKIPLFKGEGLQVCDDTVTMMQEVERELKVTKVRLLLSDTCHVCVWCVCVCVGGGGWGGVN